MSEKASEDQVSSSQAILKDDLLSQANTTAAKTKERNTTGRKKRVNKA